MIVQLSDPHVGAAGSTDPAADFRAAVQAVHDLQPRPDAVLVTGDLADHAAPEEYGLVHEALAALPMPAHVMPGNHDDRAALAAAFPRRDDEGPAYHWAARCGDVRVVACDSTRPGRVDGALPAAELAWLRDRLAAEPELPTIVAMHHPPLLIGMPAFDRIGLPAGDRAALRAVIDAFPQVQRVVAGHVHLAATGQIGRTPVITSPSTWRDRVVLELGGEEMRDSKEPAGMLVHALADGQLVSHVQPLG